MKRSLFYTMGFVLLFSGLGAQELRERSGSTMEPESNKSLRNGTPVLSQETAQALNGTPGFRTRVVLLGTGTTNAAINRTTKTFLIDMVSSTLQVQKLRSRTENWTSMTLNLL